MWCLLNCVPIVEYTKRLHLILINKPLNTIKGITQNSEGILYCKRGSYYSSIIIKLYI